MDVWLVGILPVTVYPCMGGKVWCRDWCPLAKLMEKASWLYAKPGISKFMITANDKCIGCNECSRNCQVGIDVMRYALKQEMLDNRTSSCVGYGICVTTRPGRGQETAFPTGRESQRTESESPSTRVT